MKLYAVTTKDYNEPFYIACESFTDIGMCCTARMLGDVVTIIFVKEI